MNLFVFLLVFEAVTISVCDVVCGPGDTYLPDPVNCGSFYQCSNGFPTLLNCPPPLVFSPIFNVCVWSYDYDCQISTTEYTPTVTLTATATEPISSTTELSPPTTENSSPTNESSATADPTFTATEPTSPTTENTSPSSPLTDPSSLSTEPPQNACVVVCHLTDENKPNPCDCSSFYRCANGVPELFDCAATHEGEPALVFNPISGECVYPHEYDCQISTTENMSTITMTAEPSVTVTDSTSSTSPTTESSPTIEPTFTATEPTSSATDISSPTKGPPENACVVVCDLTDEYKSNPCDCNSFYKCSNGVSELFECAATHEGQPPLVFSPISRECVYPDEYDCQITTAEDTSTITMTADPSATVTESTSTTEPTFTTTESTSSTTEISSTAEPSLPSTEPPSHTIEPPSHTTEPPSHTTEPPSHTTEPPSHTTEPPSHTIEPPANGCEVVCGPTDEYIPNPCDCSSFYKCTSGVPEFLNCEATQEGEPALVFSPILNECVQPNEYHCRIFHPCHEFDHPISCLRPTNNYNCSFCFDGCFPNRSRCDTYENLHEAGCQSFSFDESQYDSVVNTSPDCSTWVPVEPGRKRNISVTFSLKKHPLDLYYLMDFSGSMNDDKVNLVSLSSALLNALTNLTNDFQIGFGTFVDKPTPPFGVFSDYSFHHALTLTSVTGDFVEKIENTQILDGMDAPEAHGDALAQVIECDEQIGWRDDARRVVLLATDIEFHIAGDGPLGGIFDPYVDGCYLDTQGSYSKELTMDYPSIDQLASAYSKNQAVTTVIFATDVMSIGFYENVASQFKSAYVAVLNSDSSNIIDLLKNEFEKINSRMEIEKSETSDTVYFRYYSSCMGSGGDEETAICENLPASGEVTFIVEIDMPECPTDENETGMIIDFNPVGLPVSIELELSFLCD